MIECWIQQYDYSASDFEVEDCDAVIRLFLDYNWAGEIKEYEKEDARRSCPPGFGVKYCGRLLHICPIDADHCYFNFHYNHKTKWLGLIPGIRNGIHYVERYSIKRVPELIRKYMAGTIEDIASIRSSA